jgi:PKD repeat protein
MRLLTALTTALALAGCTVEEAEIPRLSGPSEFAVSVTLTATPDQLPRDGSSQSVVTATVRDAAGQPVSGQRLGISASVGSVSQSEVVTDEAGRASFAFVAPSAGTVGNSATISVVPIDTDAANAAARSVSILLTGAANSTVPTASFTSLPSSPQINQAVTFDASGSTDEGARCLDACAYAWDFGDGTTGTGRIVTHTYTGARTYVVRLAVTDAAGSSASTSSSITVANVAAPTVTLAVVPDPPLAGQAATFTATATPASGHSIVSYAWDFGDGNTQTTTGPTVTKTYSTRGTYVATVTVTDDVGQKASVSKSITITGAGVTASFTFSPSDPVTNDTVRFDGTASTGAAGTTITSYKWDFGDGSSRTESDGQTSHTYSAARTYVVRLTVTDSNDRTGTTTKDVKVSAP